MAFLVFFAFTSAAAGVQATECPGASQAQPLYRDYNPTTSDHFYTTSRGLSRPWIHSRGHQSQRLHRGRRWHRAPPTLLQFRRLKIFYTANTTEAQVVQTQGWALEDQNPIYVYPTQVCDAVPLYRLYNTGTGDHFYTIDAAERDSSEESSYNFELIAGYVYPSAAATTPAASPTASKSTTTKATTSAANSTKAAASTPAGASTPPPTNVVVQQPSNTFMGTPLPRVYLQAAPLRVCILGAQLTC
ncbi:hypothetical protein C8F04DRAFT_178711 [Mycena alexandri]|uniref:DUF5648 domain-containing protein n=1 Tax=Mycena alexandri TaxID=1745969 RepID=A0AAD6S9F3_9AGAR|nr:hypothetical protein C8F04DRAFT_178711 [Mycena alexandri]